MKQILLCLSCVAVIAGCQTPGPAVDAVWSKTRIMTVPAGEQETFLADRASGLRTEGKFLAPDKQGEEFWVKWHGAPVDRVQFEYRQLNAPDKIGIQQFRPATGSAHVFVVAGEDYHLGGMVSSWRASLWRGDRLLAELKSALW